MSTKRTRQPRSLSTILVSLLLLLLGIAMQASLPSRSLRAASSAETPTSVVYLPLILYQFDPSASPPTVTPTDTSTPTVTPTNTPTNTATNTPTNTATNTPTNTATNTPTSTATNTPTNIPASVPLDGAWAGKTNHNEPVSFQVISNGSQWRTFKFTASGSGGLCSSFTVTFTINGPGSITGRQFSFTSFNPTTSVTGQFSSTTDASGTYSVSSYLVPGCATFFSQSGTWTATHQ